MQTKKRYCWFDQMLKLMRIKFQYITIPLNLGYYNIMIRSLLKTKSLVHSKQSKSLLTFQSYSIGNIFNIFKVPVGQSNHFNSNPTPNGDKYRDWISSLPDNISISKLSIPGTHDSAAYKAQEEPVDIGKIFGRGSYQCQAWSIETQLDCGIRFLDLRIRKTGDELNTAHGPIKLRPFSQDAQKIGNFLKQNTGEFVILAFKKEGGDGGDSSDKILSQLKRIGINYYNINDSIPEIGNLRGKVWILRDNELFFNVDGATSQPLKLSGAGDISDGRDFIKSDNVTSKIFLQNNWVVKNVIQKTNATLKTAFQINHQNHNTPILKVNFLSGAGKAIELWPYQLADHKNGPNYAFDQRLSDFPNKFSIGVTVMDFPGQPLIDKIIKSNSKFKQS